MPASPAVPLRQLHTNLLTLAFLLAVLITVALPPPTAAAAGVKHSSYFVTDVYISVAGGRTSGYIRVSPDVGSADFYYVTATVYVTQCLGRLGRILPRMRTVRRDLADQSTCTLRSMSPVSPPANARAASLRVLDFAAPRTLGFPDGLRGWNGVLTSASHESMLQGVG